MTQWEETGRQIRVQTRQGKSWMLAKEQRVVSTDAPTLWPGRLQWTYTGDNCGGSCQFEWGPDEVQNFMRRYICRKQLVETRTGF